MAIVVLDGCRSLSLVPFEPRDGSNGMSDGGR
jgi:hypothetical protein